MLIDYNISLSAILALVLCTNVITEVLKNIFKQLPAEITAFIVAMLLTVSAFFASAEANGADIELYIVIEAVATGFFVSYGAQFGFDKLTEIIAKIKGADK